MSKLLLVDSQVINIEHIVRAEFAPAVPETEWFDEESETTRTTSALRAKLTLTMTSQHLETHIDDLDHGAGYHVAAASENDLVALYGQPGEEVWKYLEHIAIDPVEEMAAVKSF